MNHTNLNCFSKLSSANRRIYSGSESSSPVFAQVVCVGGLGACCVTVVCGTWSETVLGGFKDSSQFSLHWGIELSLFSITGWVLLSLFSLLPALKKSHWIILIAVIIFYIILWLFACSSSNIPPHLHVNKDHTNSSKTPIPRNRNL